MKSIFPLAMMIVSTLVVAQAYAESTQSPFACDRLALNSKARKRHFDQLGPSLRAMHKRIRELPLTKAGLA